MRLHFDNSPLYKQGNYLKSTDSGTESGFLSKLNILRLNALLKDS